MTIADIYADYTVGSPAFITAVRDNCGYGISRDEIERIAAQAPTAEAFQTIWADDDSWTDANN